MTATNDQAPTIGVTYDENGIALWIQARPGGFIGTLRLSERTGKNRMVCTITMAGIEELEAGSCSSYFHFPCFPP